MQTTDYAEYWKSLLKQFAAAEIKNKTHTKLPKILTQQHFKNFGQWGLLNKMLRLKMVSSWTAE